MIHQEQKEQKQDMSYGSGKKRRIDGDNGDEDDHEAINVFEAFLEGWMVRQEHFLDELLTAQQNGGQSRDEDLEGLVSRVVPHSHQYYQHKSRAVRSNIFCVFSPTWFTPLEFAFLWIAGFNPGVALGLADVAIGEDLTGRDQGG